MVATRATRWEPSEEADALKQDYARKKRRKSRWGAQATTPPAAPSTAIVALPSSSTAAAPEPVSTVEAAQARSNEINALLKELPPELEHERAALTAERNELVRQVVALKFGGGLASKPARAPQFLLKLPLSDDACPGGAGSLIGLIIGPRGKTQQRIQNETGCTILVRGKGAEKHANGLVNDEAEEATHVRIMGPTEEACQSARAQIAVLIDFTSEEGEKMREAQHRQLKILNGTLNEEREIDYAKLFTNPQRAANVGPLGRSSLPAAPSLLFTPAASAYAAPPAAAAAAAAAAASSSAEHDDEYAKMMAEIGGVGGDAPAQAALPAPTPQPQPLQPPPQPPQPHMAPQPHTPGMPMGGAYGHHAHPMPPGMAPRPPPPMPGYGYQQPQFRPPPPSHYQQQRAYGMQMSHGMPGWSHRDFAMQTRTQMGGGHYQQQQAYGMAPPQHPHGYGGMPAPPLQGLGMQPPLGQLTMPDLSQLGQLTMPNWAQRPG